MLAIASKRHAACSCRIRRPKRPIERKRAMICMAR